MKRPLCVIGAVFAVAMAVAFSLSPRQGIVLSVAVFVTALVVVLLQKKTLRPVAIALLSLAIGLAYGALRQHRQTQPFALSMGQTVTIQGLVTETKQTGNNSWRYTVTGEFLDSDLPRAKVILREFGEQSFRRGDMIVQEFVLKEPAYETTAKYYQRSGIAGEGYLKTTGRLIDVTPRYRIQQAILFQRQAFSAKLKRALPERSAGIVSAMVLGVTEDLSSELYAALNRSGTSHLVSVSGLHLSIVVAMASLLLERTKLSKRWQSLLLLGIIFSFSALVGFSAPITRAFVMAAVMVLGRLSNRQSDSLNSLGFAALLIAILWPHWILSLGMWLSFLSTAGILILGGPFAKALQRRYGREGKVGGKLVSFVTDGIGITAGAYLFTLPILILGTGWLSIISPVANVLVSPFSGVLTVGGIVLFLLPSGFPLLGILAWVVDICAQMILQVSVVLAQTPFATLSIDHSYLLFCLLGILVLVGLGIKYRHKKRMISSVLLCSILILGVGNLSYLAASRKDIELVKLENCQTTLLLHHKNAVLLGVPSKYELSTLQSYLDFRGIDTIEALVIPDHGEQVQSSIRSLSARYDTKCIIGPDDSYILEQLAETAPSVPVYSAGYAQIRLLEQVEISFSSDQKEIYIVVGEKNRLLKTQANYGIMEQHSPEEIGIYADALCLPPAAILAWEPISARLFGEVRIRL